MDALEALKDEEFRIGGILSPRVVDSGTTVGYDVIDLFSGKRKSFLRTQPPGEKKVGRFYLQEDGLDFANRVLLRDIDRADLVFFDEVGRMELSGQGLASPLEELLRVEVQGVYLVRPSYLVRFRDKFQLEQYEEIRVSG